MTDAGWTSEKPTKAGWYWWRCWDQSGVAIVKELGPKRPWHTDDYSAEVVLFTSKGAISSTRLNRMADGEWLGPLSPTDRQRGRIEGLREAERIARNHKGGYTLDVFTAKLIADPDGPWTLGSDIAEKLAQAAQDEKPTKEDL